MQTKGSHNILVECIVSLRLAVKTNKLWTKDLVVRDMHVINLFAVSKYVYFILSSDVGPPVTKRPRTTSVLVEQAGQSDKVLIDQVTDTETVFDEVCVCV